MIRARILGALPDSAGGIGVLMGYLAGTDSRVSRIEFVDSGGTPGPAWQRLRRFGRAVFACLGPVPDETVFHLNQASGLSTWRKLVLVSALRLRRRTYILHVHGGAFDSFLAGLGPARRMLVRDMLRHAAGVIVLGERWRDLICDTLGLSPRTFHVLPNAVPGPRHVPDARDVPVVLFSGQLTQRKGVIDLLTAWGTLPDHVRSRLVLAGDLDDPDGTISHLLERTPDVETTGWIGPDRIAAQLARASILVLPSYQENLPMSLLDGMAWGLAPVVTDVGAVGEVVTHGENGWIVPAGDAEAIARALEVLLTDRHRRLSLGRAARRRWEEEYRIRTYRQRLDRIYADVLGHRS